jgi:hypothetical protein
MERSNKSANEQMKNPLKIQTEIRSDRSMENPQFWLNLKLPSDVVELKNSINKEEEN